MSGLTGQQKNFVQEYLKLKKKNQEQAAINAGYSPRSAGSQASQLLKNPKVSAYLEEQETLIVQQIQKEFIFDALDAKKVMEELMKDDSTPEAVRLSAAKDFLDRAGFKPVEKQEVDSKGELGIKVIWDDDDDGD